MTRMKSSKLSIVTVSHRTVVQRGFLFPKKARLTHFSRINLDGCYFDRCTVPFLPPVHCGLSKLVAWCCSAPLRYTTAKARYKCRKPACPYLTAHGWCQFSLLYCRCLGRNAVDGGRDRSSQVVPPAEQLQPLLYCCSVLLPPVLFVSTVGRR